MVSLEHSVLRATVWGGEAHRVIVPVAPALAMLDWSDSEEQHDGAVVLLRAEVVQLIDRASKPSVLGQQQDALLKHGRRNVQVGMANRV